MSKRLLDVVVALAVLLLAAPVLLVAMAAVWIGDGHAPLYCGRRAGRGGTSFAMFKLRTMTPDAAGRGGPSTPRSDPRVTPVGRWLRRSKLDELPQFANVLIGQMSVVGPRPNVLQGGVDRYTPDELRLLTVRPGVTDLASILFCDEAEILDGAADPDERYDRVIRPWKSRLGLLYIDRARWRDDVEIIWLTALALVARPAALRGVDAMLARWGAELGLRRICRRDAPLPEGLPPDAPA